MAAQTNGRIVGAGPTDNPSSSIGVVRWLATGAVDSKFGMDGIATLAVIPVEKVRLALAPDGKFVIVANRQVNSTNYNILFWRCLTGGTLDEDFGTAVQILIQPPAGKSELARCILVQTDGKIVVGGGSNDAFFVMRLSVTGSPDPTFGSNGALRSGTVNQQTRITAPAQQTDDLIVGCGWQKDGTVTRNSFLLRLLPLGAGDPTFGTQSIRLLIAEGELNALSLRGDEAIVAAGAYQKAMH